MIPDPDSASGGTSPSLSAQDSLPTEANDPISATLKDLADNGFDADINPEPSGGILGFDPSDSSSFDLGPSAGGDQINSEITVPSPKDGMPEPGIAFDPGIDDPDPGTDIDPGFDDPDLGTDIDPGFDDPDPGTDIDPGFDDPNLGSDRAFDPGSGGDLGGPGFDPGSGGDLGGPGFDPGSGGDLGGPGFDPGSGGDLGGPGFDPGSGGDLGGPGFDPGSGGDLGGAAPAALAVIRAPVAMRVSAVTKAKWASSRSRSARSAASWHT